MSWHENRRKNWCLHPLVVVGIDADFILLEVESILAGLDGAQLVMAVQVGPSPQAAVDDMRQTFTVRHLQTPVQRSGLVRVAVKA